MTDQGLPVWNLSGLYAGPDDPAIEHDLAEAGELIGRLDAEPAAALRDYERANTLLARVAAFAALHDAGGLAPDLQARVDATAARAPALEDVAPELAAPPPLDPRIVATLLSQIAKAGPGLWRRTRAEPENELLPWTWAEAVDIALSAADALSPAMGEAMRRVLAERRVHASAAGEALSHPAADRGPYVRLMFDGGLRSVLTLAHELGHAAHQLLSRPLGVLRCAPEPALAETVAAVSEQAAFRLLLDRATGRERPVIQAYGARDLYGAVVRHAGLARMERRGEVGDRGWKAAMEAMAGPAAAKAEPRDGWRAFAILSRAPGSAWIYPFARLAAVAVLEAREADRTDFAARWNSLLVGGGTRGAAEAMSGLGLDVAHPAFWARALARA